MLCRRRHQLQISRPTGGNNGDWLAISRCYIKEPIIDIFFYLASQRLSWHCHVHLLIDMLFFRNRFRSILSIGLFSEGYALGRKPPKKEQAKSNQRDAYRV